MVSFRAKPVGWRRDSYRHYLAAKGISTVNRRYAAETNVGQFIENLMTRGRAKQVARVQGAGVKQTQALEQQKAAVKYPVMGVPVADVGTEEERVQAYVGKYIEPIRAVEPGPKRLKQIEDAWGLYVQQLRQSVAHKDVVARHKDMVAKQEGVVAEYRQLSNPPENIRSAMREAERRLGAEKEALRKAQSAFRNDVVTRRQTRANLKSLGVSSTQLKDIERKYGLREEE